VLDSRVEGLRRPDRQHGEGDPSPILGADVEEDAAAERNDGCKAVEPRVVLIANYVPDPSAGEPEASGALRDELAELSDKTSRRSNAFGRADEPPCQGVASVRPQPSPDCRGWYSE